MKRFDELFHDHAAASLDKQLALGDALGTHEWKFDLDSGRITFTTGRLFSRKRITYAVQVLGTESEISNTWLWAWANEQTPVPSSLLHAANRLKVIGDREGIVELAEPRIDLETCTGHQLAMVASGLLAANCYYRGPYEDGAVFLLIRDPSFPAPTFEPLSRVAVIFPQLLSNLEIADHKRCLLSYLGYYKLQVRDEGEAVTVETVSGMLMADFDGQRRLTDLRVKTK
ncbi:MAG: hypothetical protein KA419_15575 [Acidobacteria bacterium]|nr:hypothetical protein [Acidobacteriota bacterium]